MKKRSTGILLAVLGVLSLVLITAGVTYAFFSYTKEGETENTISTGTIVFLYTEIDGQGAGISITDALPTSDADGKVLAATNEYFDFEITADTTGVTIPYTITARKKADSTLAEDQVKLYLTKTDAAGALTTTENAVSSTLDAQGNVKLYSEYTDYEDAPAGVVERVLYTDTVPANTTGYDQNYRLRMWLKGAETAGTDVESDYSAFEFVATSEVSGTTALDADELISDGKFITSTAYYALSAADRANYERVGAVNTTDRTILTVSQVTELSNVLPTGFVAGEQFYQINGQTFTVNVNVYATGNVQ